MSSLISRAKTVAFQGEPGAYANLAARECLPHVTAVPRPTFEDAIAAVRAGETDLAIIPVENSLHGRIADIHHLLPEAGLYIVGEHFHRVRHQLLGVKGATFDGIKTVFSQGPALGQCLKIIRERKWTAQNWHDTAGSARHIAEMKDPSIAAIASALAAEIYGLDILKADIEDESHNMTRFLIMAREPDDAPLEVRPRRHHLRVPRAQRSGRALQGAGRFRHQRREHDEARKLSAGRLVQRDAVLFRYRRPSGRDAACALALEELRFFTSTLTILGVYPASPLRDQIPTA